MKTAADAISASYMLLLHIQVIPAWSPSETK